MRVVLFILLTASIFAETVDVKTNSGIYEIYVSEDYTTLKVDYLEMTKAYIEESNDYTDLKEAFDEYQKVTHEIILSKDKVIKDQKDLITIKDDIIMELKKPDIISFIPNAYYEFSDISSIGIGLAILLDSFYIQAQIGYPLETRIGIGWKF